MAGRRLGMWLVGARGGVATTMCVGLAALQKGISPTHGLVSEAPQFADLDLAGWDEWHVGGHEIRESSLAEEAQQLHDKSRIFEGRVLAEVADALQQYDANIHPGTLVNVGPMIESLADSSLRSRTETPRAAVDRLRQDIQQFAETNQLDHVVVMNVASTEPPCAAESFPATWAELAPTLENAETCQLPASSLYAVAAFELGYSYVNFTPSLGTALPALQELAIERGACHMGHDGKTGETLLKSVLAPMFASRQLAVMSWVGHNIFGNLDGKVLNDPENKKTKVVSKDRLLHQILGYDPQTLVGIEYIESLGDWKTAWDHIHFQGFLGTPMVMQFIWQGCDSLLAAPLALDLVRFTERAHRHEDRGLLTFLSSFFKSPLGIDEHDFIRQFQMLEAWAESVRAEQAK